MKHLLLFGVLCLISIPALGQDHDPAPTLSVIGVAGDVNDARWSDHRIGLEIRNLITERLLDNYLLLEDSPERYRTKYRLAEEAWRLDGDHTEFDETIALFGRAGAEFVAYAHVSLEGIPWQQDHASPMRMMRTIVTVDVHVVNTITGARMTGSANAIIDASVDSMAFEIRDQTIDFEATSLGLTTRGTVLAALDDLTPHRASF